jgi:5-methylcytosine-specific restriction enzyme A
VRQEFSAKVRRAAFERSGGRCESCGSLLGAKVEYDHQTPDFMGGKPDLDNCRAICRGCHKEKTKNDIKQIAKVKRLVAKRAGVKKPRKMTRWRKMNGDLVIAPRER